STRFILDTTGLESSYFSLPSESLVIICAVFSNTNESSPSLKPVKSKTSLTVTCTVEFNDLPTNCLGSFAVHLNDSFSSSISNVPCSVTSLPSASNTTTESRLNPSGTSSCSPKILGTVSFPYVVSI